MSYEDFNINDVKGSISIINELLDTLNNIDIIHDSLSEVMITSKFPNIFYYKSVNLKLLAYRDSELLETYHNSDYYTSMRLLDFIKDNNGDINSNYNKYFKDFLNDLNSLYGAFLNSSEYEHLSFSIFRSRLFKQYIINIVHICIDIHRCVR